MEIKFKHLILFIGFFVVVKIVFFYLTPAEWGDSYRFLRAGEYLSHFSYPLDEKRLPLFPFILSFAFLLKVDPLVWGRMAVLVLSVLCLIFTFKLGTLLLKNTKSSFLAMVLTAFSPVFFYWTGKVYAEVLFTFLVLLSLTLYFGYKGKHKSLLLGLMCGLAFMTRFEGFLLFLAILAGIFVKRNIKNLLFYLSSFSIVSAPYFLFRFINLRNFSSAYFLEPSQFSFDFKAGIAFFASLAFLFGFIPLLDLSSLKKFLTKKNIGNLLPILVFVVLELLLSFVWQAAIPRLFVPIIPLLSLGLAKRITAVPKINFKNMVFYVAMWALFLLGRFYVRLPFLVFGKLVLIPLLLSFIYALFLHFRKQSYLYLLIIAGILSSLLVAYFFKNVYKTVYQAALFGQTLEGKIAYSDETGVTNWYLKEGKGVFYDLDYSEEGEYKWLLENDISYIIDTNEHNEGSKIEVFKDEEYKSRFEIVKKFRSSIGTAETMSTIYKISKQ
ncbi:MAG: glycosyltransferase family 39 protein [Patescibacteria group bacterium]|nr:glycosyltransferase family 39 protein [Patescibacteria group bacterium]